MREAVADILLTRILAEEAAGFPRLHRIPSSARFYFLDYYNGISKDERLALHEAHALMGASWFGYPPDKIKDAPRLAAFERYLAKRGWFDNWQYSGYRELRSLRNIAKVDPEHGLVKNLPPSALRKIQSIETAKSAELRKTAKLAFNQMLGAKPENQGDWVYAGKIDNEEVVVRVDYGSRNYQLRYEVLIPRLKPWQKFTGPTYERLLGFGPGGWNQIGAGTEDQAFALLTELVREVFDISMTVHEKVLKQTE